MSKQGMKRPEASHNSSHEPAPVPEIKGKAKHGNIRANPVIPGTKAPNLKVFHSERPISEVYSAIDTDLARDNLENDITAADLQDL